MPTRRPPTAFSSPSLTCTVDSSLMYPLSGLPVRPPRGRQLWSYLICGIASLVLIVIGGTVGLRHSVALLDHVVVSSAKSMPDSLHLSSRVIALSRIDEVEFKRSANGGLEASLGLPVEVTSNWAAYAPWKPAGNYAAPPHGCAITQVTSLLIVPTRAVYQRMVIH